MVGGKSVEEHEKLAASFGNGWDFRVAAVVERLPVIMEDIPDWEQDMYDLQERRREGQRVYPKPLWQPEEDDFEEEEEEEEEEAYDEEVVAIDDEGADEGEDDVDQEPADGAIKEEKGMLYVPASRVTEADEKDDRTSLFRALQHSVFLIQKVAEDEPLRMGNGGWRFVSGEYMEELGMTRSAIQHVNDQCVKGVEDVGLWSMESMAENGLQCFSVTNAPTGYLTLPYDEDYQKKNDVYGAKLFFYRSQLLTTAIEDAEVGDKGKTFLWITAEEVHEYFDEEIADYLHMMIGYNYGSPSSPASS